MPHTCWDGGVGRKYGTRMKPSKTRTKPYVSRQALGIMNVDCAPNPCWTALSGISTSQTRTHIPLAVRSECMGRDHFWRISHRNPVRLLWKLWERSRLVWCVDTSLEYGGQVCSITKVTIFEVLTPCMVCTYRTSSRSRVSVLPPTDLVASYIS